MRRHILRNDGASPDHCIFADADPAPDGGIGANRDSLGNLCGCEPFLVGVAGLHERKAGGPRPPVVGEYYPGSDEDIVCNGHAFPDHDGIFNRDVVTVTAAALDVAVVADVTIRTNDCVTANVSKRPHPGARTNCAGVHQGCAMKGRLESGGHFGTWIGAPLARIEA